MIDKGVFTIHSGKLVGIKLSNKKFKIEFLKTHNKRIYMVTTIERHPGK